MTIFIELLPLMLGSMIGLAIPARSVTAQQRFVWVVLGIFCSLIANLSSGEGLQFLPIDVLLVFASAIGVVKLKQQIVSN